MRDNSFTFNFNFIKKVLAIVLLPLILIFAGSHLGEIYQSASGKNKINVWSKQRFDDFYALPENSLDMVFIGSSHSYCTFDPEKVDPLLGTSSFQLGMPLQLPDASYYTLLEVLNTQAPETVVMEVYWDVLSTKFDVKQVDAFFKVLRNAELKADYEKNVFPLNEKVKYKIDALHYQQDFLLYENQELLTGIEKKHKLKRTITQFEGEEYYRSKGYIYCDYIMTDEAYQLIAEGGGSDGKNWKMNAKQEYYLKKITELCKANAIELILVTAPISNISFKEMKNYENIHNQVQAFADFNGVRYLDYNLANAEEKLFADEHFRDGGHLNDNGVQIADEYFAKWYNEEKIK